MRFPLTRMLSLVAIVLAGGGLASAQVTIIDSNRAHPELSDTRHPALPNFAMQQRAAIYNAVMKENAAKPLSVDTRIEVGTKLPESVELHPLPDAILAEISAAKKYKYAVWASEVLLVDPVERTVADILREPR